MILGIRFYSLMYSGCIKGNPSSIYDPWGGTLRPLARLDVEPSACQLLCVGGVCFWDQRQGNCRALRLTIICFCCCPKRCQNNSVLQVSYCKHCFQQTVASIPGGRIIRDPIISCGREFCSTSHIIGLFWFALSEHYACPRTLVDWMQACMVVHMHAYRQVGI